jgi:hypothetical protein
MAFTAKYREGGQPQFQAGKRRASAMNADIRVSVTAVHGSATDG